MALRYIDTNFFKSPFVRGLKAPLKTLYIFIICDCSGAGIWSKDLDVAGLYIGEKISEKDFEYFIKMGKAVDLKNGRYFFPDFILHQYPNGLSEKNPAQKNFIHELKNYNLLDNDLQIIKTLQRPFQGSLVMVKEMVMEEVTVNTSSAREKISVEKTDFDIALDGWLDMRKRKKKPATERAIKMALSKLQELAPDDEPLKIKILNQSEFNGWTDLYPPKTEIQKQQQPIGGKGIEDALFAYEQMKK